MDIAIDVRDFLSSRRARITPAQAGLPAYSASRRVPGLKREEVAVLAGVSTEYYARLERGNLRGVSESVLASVARALQLDEAERAHLFDLARAAGTSPAKEAGRRARPRVRPSIARILAGMTGIPAYIRTSRMDVVAANEICRALYAGVLDESALPLNLARFVFLDPRARELYVGWDAMADDFSASLRVEAGRNPKDPALNALVGELATGSPEFATRWARHTVKAHRTARKILHHPLIGEIELTGDALELPGEDLTLIAYTAEPDSPAAEQLAFLASWHQTRQRDAADDAVEEVHDEESGSAPTA
jgi:transcriptional regulator with XRE-family HTH domain